MFKRTKVCVGVLAALGGSLLTGTQAFAQQAERVEITGSRLKSFEVETASPIVTIGAEAIKIEGVRNVEQLLNNMPQVFADQGAQVSNGASGAATVNLRNLGSTRTLVLVNGRRLPAGSVNDPSQDLNQIPISLLKRVEILTGGASAIYGSDAIAGVVNFILNDRFEGVQIDFNHQFYNHQQKGTTDAALNARNYNIPGDKTADGQSTDFSLTIGGNFAGNKGNATVYLGYKKEKALLESERDFSACALGAGASAFNCGGSGTSYPGQFTDFDTYALTVTDAAGSTRDYVGSRDAYNFGPLNYFRRPSDRYNVAALGRYDINDAARIYTEFTFHDDHTVAQIAPSGLFFYSPVLHWENPYLSQSFRDAFNTASQTVGRNFAGAGDTVGCAPGETPYVDCSPVYIGRRNVEGGGRQDDRRHTSFRAVTGVKGDFDIWNYDVSAQMGKVLYQQTYFNDFSNVRIGRALNAVDDGSGNVVCQSVLDGSDPNCVPYNPFQLGGVTAGALSYLQTPLFARGETSQMVVQGSLAGDLGGYGLKSPMAKNGLAVVVGLESRLEKLTFNTDTAFSTGDGAGQGGPTIGLGGQYRVKEGFTELRLPVMEKQPFAELLNLTGSYRRSSYSTGKTTNTFGLGMEYAPVKEVKVRGSYQRAARAANIVELFSAQSLGLYDMNSDPCAGATPSATLTECARSGVTATQYGSIPDSPAGQYNQISGGNPDLKPETAKSLTLGIVAQPMRELTMSLDFFRINVEDVISSAPAPVTLNGCLASGDAAFCSLIHRDAVGSLWLPNSYILATNANLASKKTSGLDIQVDYGLKIPDAGQVDLSFIGTKLLKFESQDLPNSKPYDCAGFFGDTACGTPLPKWRHKLRAGWNTPWDFGVAATWRYIAGVKIENLNPDIGGPAIQSYRQELGARSYFDLQASYNVTKNLAIRAAINNLFDRDPPLRTNGAGFTNGNTYPVVYDALGRQITIGLTATY